MNQSCPTCTFPAGCTCKPPTLLDAAIKELRDSAAQMNVASERMNRATAQLQAALAISNANNRSER